MKLHRLFQMGIILKALHGLTELILGFFLLLDFSLIVDLVKFLFRSELIEDPSDALANFIITGLLHVTVKGRLFAAVYLFIHGIVNIVLAGALMSRRMWAFLSAGAVLILLLIYQIILLITKPSIMICIITAIDVLIILLMHSEYIRLKRLKINKY
jgi:uncharacterized membrane protein